MLLPNQWRGLFPCKKRTSSHPTRMPGFVTSLGIPTKHRNRPPAKPVLKATEAGGNVRTALGAPSTPLGTLGWILREPVLFGLASPK
ncbi:hypothetical protein NDU88_006968 [Pleurodeles waltl]|uniref:Uncharacterized protein n=1 Tax=Pleurodeles waltl TaxID=8319 RepID=A0AAV7SRF6_PLEWA|nr:hypothetical protein NDU88_006968 [Pleurodeles waltl]